jgi:hypothetical protein
VKRNPMNGFAGVPPGLHISQQEANSLLSITFFVPRNQAEDFK